MRQMRCGKIKRICRKPLMIVLADELRLAPLVRPSFIPFASLRNLRRLRVDASFPKLESACRNEKMMKKK